MPSAISAFLFVLERETKRGTPKFLSLFDMYREKEATHSAFSLFNSTTLCFSIGTFTYQFSLRMLQFEVCFRIFFVRLIFFFRLCICAFVVVVVIVVVGIELKQL
ncbi:hypothetical protein S83_048414 [Arachis hypogaea]